MQENLVINPPEPVLVPVIGGGMFPVRRVYCVGRNYAAHAIEMGGDTRDAPFFFQKPASAIVLNGSEIPYPVITSDFHHEIELVLAIGRGGNNVPIAQADEHVYGLAVGLDMTRRDRQAEAKKAGRPWEIAKAFDLSAPISEITPLQGELPHSGSIALRVNGELRQQADLADLVWNCAEVVATLSTHYRLEPGDLIYTGTPAGVGPVEIGDRLVGSVEGLHDLHIQIVDPEE